MNSESQNQENSLNISEEIAAAPGACAWQVTSGKMATRVRMPTAIAVIPVPGVTHATAVQEKNRLGRTRRALAAAK